MMRIWEIKNVLLYLALVVLMLPLVVVDMPPIADLPNHLARFFVINHFDANLHYQAYYSVKLVSIPNLITDLVAMMPVLRDVESMTFGVMLVFAYVLLTVFGVLDLSRANFGAVSVLALAVVLVVYNRMLLWGMMNYMVGVGMLLVSFAVWIRIREQSALVMVAVSSFFSLAIYYSHLFPWGLYVVMVGVYEIQAMLFAEKKQALQKFHRLVLVGLQFLIPLVLFLFFSPTAEVESRLAFGDFMRKIINAPIMPFNNYSQLLDAGTFLIFFGVFGLGFLLGFIRIKRAMWGVIAAMCVIHLAMPQFLMSSPGADLRTIIPLVLVTLGSIELTPKGTRYGQLLALVLIPLFLVRTGVVVANWSAANEGMLEEYREVLSKLPEGAKVADIFLNNTSGWFTNPPHAHYVTLAVIERSAFVPKMFAHPAQQPIEFSPQCQELARRATSLEAFYPDPSSPLVPDAGNPQNEFYYMGFVGMDYLLLSNYKALGGKVPEFLREVLSTDNLRLYQVDQASLKSTYPDAEILSGQTPSCASPSSSQR